MLNVEELLWNPAEELNPTEQRIANRAAKKRKLFVFLRERRHELFDEPFQRELIEMYRQTGAGKIPLAPARLAMLTLLQVYSGEADHEAVELTVDSRRWQMVLDCLGAEEPLCCQKTLYDFRMRLIHTGMDQRLLERTVELARRYGGFDAKALRAALDSSPLWGQGRVEDTVNLIGHAARNVIDCLAALTRQTVAEVLEATGLSLFESQSLKATLDVDWTDPEQKQQALQRLCDEIEVLQQWVMTYVPAEMSQPPLAAALSTLHTVLEQDLEPDPNGGVRIREGVAKDRRISIEEAQMRHGRKSASQRIDGYKRHIVRDLDEQLILAAEVQPANRPDSAALGPLLDTAQAQNRKVVALHIDRGYLDETVVPELDTQGVDIVCKPWPARNSQGLFNKRDFHIDLQAAQVTCPAGHTTPITPGQTARFPATGCSACHLREQCTTSTQGRSLSIHTHEDLLQRLAVLPSSAEGRAQLRERVDVEHGLAHVSQRQGNQARYNGTQKNTYHLRMVCAIQNLERAQRLIDPPEPRAVWPYERRAA
jgi:IS5 family transposase